MTLATCWSPMLIPKRDWLLLREAYCGLLLFLYFQPFHALTSYFLCKLHKQYKQAISCLVHSQTLVDWGKRGGGNMWMTYNKVRWKYDSNAVLCYIGSTAVVSWNCVGISRPTGTVCADLNRLEHNYVGGRLPLHTCLMLGARAPLEPALSSLSVFGGNDHNFKISSFVWGILHIMWLSFCYDAWQVSLTVKYPFFFWRLPFRSFVLIFNPLCKGWNFWHWFIWQTSSNQFLILSSLLVI